MFNLSVLRPEKFERETKKANKGGRKTVEILLSDNKTPTLTAIKLQITDYCIQKYVLQDFGQILLFDLIFAYEILRVNEVLHSLWLTPKFDSLISVR